MDTVLSARVAYSVKMFVFGFVGKFESYTRCHDSIDFWEIDKEIIFFCFSTCLLKLSK